MVCRMRVERQRQAMVIYNQKLPPRLVGPVIGTAVGKDERTSLKRSRSSITRSSRSALATVVFVSR